MTRLLMEDEQIARLTPLVRAARRRGWIWRLGIRRGETAVRFSITTARRLDVVASGWDDSTFDVWTGSELLMARLRLDQVITALASQSGEMEGARPEDIDP